MPAQPLSTEQLGEAAKLKALFQDWQRVRKASGLPSSQEAAAELLGFGQSALAQYLNGKIPLNVDVCIKFVKLLGVGMAEFSPSLADQASRVAGSIGRRGATGGADATNPTTAPGLSLVLGEAKYSQPLPAQLQAQVVLGNLSEREAVLIHKYRMATVDGKVLIDDMSDAAPKEDLFIVHDETKAQ